MRGIAAVIGVAAALAWGAPVAAQPVNGTGAGSSAAQAAPSPKRRYDTPDDIRYFIRGGGLAFGLIPAVTSLSTFFVNPPNTPRLFSADEGGETPSTAHHVPEYMVVIGASSLTFGLVGLPRDEARWYHLKGYAEAGLTTLALTQVAKVTFGRHRPDYQPPDDPSDDERRSFFSGHASETLFATTYFALFLRYHGLERFRPNGTWVWWEPLPYAALAGLSFYVPWTRVVDHRHHLSDVLVGGGVGATTSIVFFYWQEHRWLRDSAGLGEPEPAPSVVLLPDFDINGVQLVGSF